MIRHFQKWEARILASAGLGWLMSGVALVILTTTVVFLTLQLRANLRSRILNRDATILSSVADMQVLLARESEPGLDMNRAQDQLKLLLRISRLAGIMGLRLYDAEGQFETSYPNYVQRNVLGEEDLKQLGKMIPVSRFYESVSLRRVFGRHPVSTALQDEDGEPVLEILIPLHKEPGRQWVGSAQFLIRGDEISSEFSSLDTHLVTQAAGVWFVAGIPLVLILNWGLQRIRLSRDRLVRQSEQLHNANRELALAAKTSALGAMSAHLLHGLKSPVFCLQTLAKMQQGSAGHHDAEWAQALVSIREMQGMINRVIQLLQNQEGLEGDVLSVRQVISLLRDRMSAQMAKYPECQVIWPTASTGLMNGREANLLLMVLENLVNNSLEAVGPEGQIEVRVREKDGKLAFHVQDNGPGLPDYLRSTLFQPCISTKPNGSGMGLAISRRLIESMDGELVLETSGQGKTVFRVAFRPDVSTVQEQISLRY